ncbi:DNA-binding transcriptional regulator, LysR family [Vibrio xiamenensis]|uniref:DNA-binding transcriptional regulator, LysR family n=1 Tax=Vibrio xiamenensis TaxID=861298 RepID=A0A1G7XY89_9VIBR|nr:LysR family transcriptional regulator [Vibrio xiamenensis]SDG77690.1 DNA-binding transcriptional regulator, LysR family [Vibrio xiamenensis]SDG89107.1 DNA-binding transcriptional regulator, LysR family [Vibrio xiamenensis]
MDMVLLKTFLEVSQTRNFAKAADKLCVSPSTISARIRQLEEHLGISLFTRKHHQVLLTPAGERMERHAHFILQAWDRAYEDTALSEKHKRRLVIAGVASLWDVFLQRWLNDIYRDFPTLGIRAEESTPLRVVDKLEKGMIDLGFLYEPPLIKGIAVEEITKVQLQLVSSEPEQNVEHAIGEGYIRVEWGKTFATLHESFFPQRLLARARVNSGGIALSLIRYCGGAAYLPTSVVSPLLASGELHSVADAPNIEMKAYAAYHVRSEQSELVKELLSHDQHF